MKANRFTHWLRPVLLLLLVVTGAHVLQAQTSGPQKEYTGKAAAQIVPGARYVLEGSNTSFPAYVKFETGKTVPFASFPKWLHQTFQLDADVRFDLLRTDKDEQGRTHYRFVQTKKGLPVDLATLQVHVRDGQVLSFNGEVYTLPELSATPALSESEALRNAMAHTGATKFMWQNPFWEQEIKRKTGDPAATYFPKGELCWNRGAAGDFSLAYRFDVHAEDGSGARRILVDAQSGRILNSFALESNCSPASVNTIWNGNRGINTDKYTADDFRLRDDCQAAEAWIRDWGSTTTSASPFEIENTTNTWTTDDERFGASVLWHTMECYAYFLNQHGRSSYDDADGDVTGYINAVFGCGGGCTTTNNASMSFSGGTMKVGRGDDGMGNDLPLINSWGTLDIIAHEYTHAVTGSSSMLVYQGESGALNESFSDIFGDAVERRTTGTNDWLVGGDRGAIRSLQNPNAFSDPDTYQGSFWASTCNGCGDDGGVHTNSGVQNYWFYLLARPGGTLTDGTNDNSDVYRVSALGFNKAEDLAFENVVNRLSSGSNYAAARAGAIDAAEDFYGACSNEVIQVKNAWYAVGVGNPGMPVFNPTNTEPAVCSPASVDIDLEALQIANQATATYTWSAVYNGLTGGSSNCNAGCGTYIGEVLTNPGGAPKTVVYTVTPSYDGCTGASFTVSKTYYARPAGSNLSTSVLCSRDPFSINLQSRITNNVPSNFSWTVNYNGLSGGNGAGSGDFINETLSNATGAPATAVYTVTPVSETGTCSGATFTVSVTVPPMLLIEAGPNQTVYYGYPPAACATLSWSGATGGTPPYTIVWSTGQNSQSITVCPITTTTYTVSITDANGCLATDMVTVCVIDVRCGNRLDKVELCHVTDEGIPQTLCVAKPSVPAHLAHGDQLAACGTDHNCPPAGARFRSDFQELLTGNTLHVFPNPFSQSATLTFASAEDGRVSLRLTDLLGRTVRILYDGTVDAGETYQLDIEGAGLTAGMYYCLLQHPDGSITTVKLIVQ